MTAAYFILSNDSDRMCEHRLLSYSGTIKAGKMILTLKVEVEESMEYVLSSLEEILKHSRKGDPKRQNPVQVAPRRIGKTVLLALPAPDREV